MIRRYLRFFGRVQGVGFRYYSVQEARALGLTGWVRNLPDGSVEMEVQGPEQGIDTLIVYLRGRKWVLIQRMEAKALPLQKERDFQEIW